MTRLVLEEVSKNLGGVKAVDQFTCEIRDGEFVVLVGPSGCGKTTLLRLILGVLKPDSGHIYIDGTVIDDLPIEKRNIGFVPQDFGLFPHLTVWGNVAYGLRIQNRQDETIRTRVGDMMKMLELEDLGDRFSGQLSWGQRQRTALARALVVQPRLLLLDEPLSAVDWVAREEIIEGILGLQGRLKITTIYVTHDIDEALSLGHRVMVMNHGRLEQYGEPEKLLNEPESEFIRRFVRSTPRQQRLTKRIMSDVLSRD